MGPDGTSTVINPPLWIGKSSSTARKTPFFAIILNIVAHKKLRNFHAV
jgi:hypothetical protein